MLDVCFLSILTLLDKQGDCQVHCAKETVLKIRNSNLDACSTVVLINFQSADDKYADFRKLTNMEVIEKPCVHVNAE